MKIVLCGEAWGRREAEHQHPLVGPSGRELTTQLGHATLAPFMLVACRECKKVVPFTDARCSQCGKYCWPNEYDLINHWGRLRRENQIVVTNVFNQQPPNNDLGHFFGTERETDMPAWKASKNTSGTHLRGEFEHHIFRLRKEIEDWKPNLVIAMGNAACWALLEQYPRITDMRGYFDWSQRLNVKIIPTYHPAHVLRNPAFRTTCIADYRKAVIEAQFPEIRRPERWITVIDPTPDGIAEGYAWFQRPATAYANDIETFRDQISIVGFARSASDALVVVFRNEGDSQNPNYWPTPELEFDAWKLVIHGLQTPQPKIYQNGVFDISHFVRMGIHPKNAKHDTMLWHHSFLPELPKSLGYLGSIYANDVAWKRMRHRDSIKRDE